MNLPCRIAIALALLAVAAAPGAPMRVIAGDHVVAATVDGVAGGLPPPPHAATSPASPNARHSRSTNLIMPHSSLNLR